MSSSPWRFQFWRWQRRLAPYLFISPFLLLFLAFMIYPLGRSIFLSLHQTAGLNRQKFIGLGNYRFLFTERYFWLAVLNTASLVVVFLVIQLPLSLGLAMLVNAKSVRFKSFFRFAFFSTHLVGMVFASVLFVQMLNPRQGLINRSLGLFLGHVPDIHWLADPVLARVAILLAWLWLSVGWGMIYFLAALQAVDPELHDAASVDGAGHWHRFRAVTLPGIRPVMILLLLAGTITGFQLFEIPYIFFPTDAGPGGAGLTVVSYLVASGWQTNDLGYASAVGWMLVFIILGVSIIQYRLSFGGRRNA